MTRLEENLRRARTELESQQAELARKAAEAQRLQDQLCSLNNAVFSARDRVAQTEEQCASFKEQLEDMRKTFLDAWGNPSIPGGPNYRNVVAIETAIADFPRVHAHLTARLREAQRALTEFEKRHGLR